MSQKPVIGIVTVHDESPIPRIFTNEHYPKAVIRGGGTPVMLPVTTDREVLQQFTCLCDGFLFSGGQDISPMRYGELQSRLCGSTSLLLDVKNFSIWTPSRLDEGDAAAFWRHSGTVNVSFWDGHAENRKSRDVPCIYSYPELATMFLIFNYFVNGELKAGYESYCKFPNL